MKTNIRTMTDLDSKIQFRRAFAKHLASCVEPTIQHPETLTDQQLCVLYEECSMHNKRGLWNLVAQDIGKTHNWTRKYYLNTFKANLYPGQLTEQHKNMLGVRILELMAQHVSKSEIVQQCKAAMEHTDIFPSRILSFAYQFIDSHNSKTSAGVPHRSRFGAVKNDFAQLANLSQQLSKMSQAKQEPRPENMLAQLEQLCQQQDQIARKSAKNDNVKSEPEDLGQLFAELDKIL